MLSFDTTRPFSFEIDGKAYALPPAQFGEAEELLEAFYQAQGDDKISVVRAVFEKRANKTTMTAINRLGFKQAGELFKAWLGGEPGESSPSAV